MGENLETAAIYHFFQVTRSLDSLEVIGGNVSTNSGARTTSQVSVDFLLRLAESHSSIKHLRLVNITYANSLSSHFSKFKALKILSLDGFLLRMMQREELVASLSSVEVLHLNLHCFDESNPRDQDFTEETLLSNILSSKRLLDLDEMVVSSRPINIQGLVTASPRSLKLWKEAKEVLEGNELIESGKVKLKTWEAGKTGE